MIGFITAIIHSISLPPSSICNWGTSEAVEPDYFGITSAMGDW